jgi:hypothetical protein
MFNIKQVQQFLDSPWQFQEGKAPTLQNNWHINVAKLSALDTRHLYPHEIFLVLIFRRGHSAAGRMWMKNSSDNIGNRTRYLTACSAVPQQTVLMRPRRMFNIIKRKQKKKIFCTSGNYTDESIIEFFLLRWFTFLYSFSVWIAAGK